MASNLLIVESPAKAKTINSYLGKDFVVLASFGHVRDLKRKSGAVDVDHDFAMKYELIERNVRNVDAIVREAKRAETIYLATDLDREGEAISWHILEILKDKGLLKDKAVHRVTFSEITKSAIQHAVAHPRTLSYPMIHAQQARRALDYLVGFTLSPVLWRKVHAGLSAGRVQSPALRMIVEREEVIEAFEPKEYWSVQADLAHRKGNFTARLTELRGKKFEQFDLVTEDQASLARAELLNAADGKLVVSKVGAKERHRKPAAPFTTSTLQQEASRKLGFSVSKTMRTAQTLYEGLSVGGEGQVGLITYMRTDATALSEDAVADIREHIQKAYGSKYLPASPQVYRTKSKNAQEAHEAIRPSKVSRTPESIARFLEKDQLALYRLIWNRTVACQMTEALMNTVTVDFSVGTADHAFRATGTTVVFPGFLTVYEEGKDTAKSDDDADRRLPHLVVGDVVPLSDILIEQHFTEPPPRFNEATLVKTMEEYGIGRPSTYATIIEVLQKREYVTLDGRRFKPTDIGRAASHFLTEHFHKYVDYDFTAKLEDDLDAVSRDEKEWIPLMHEFWGPFKALVDEKDKSVERTQGVGARVLGEDPKTGLPVSVRLGKFGPVAIIGHQENRDVKVKFASLEEGQSITTITLQEALALFRLPRELGVGEDGEAIVVAVGRFGPYIKQGKTYASLEQTDDPYSITLDAAKERVQAKRELEANRIVQDFGDKLQVLNGKFGQYITDGNGVNVTVPKDKDAKTITKEECLALLANPPVRKGGGGGKFKKKFKGGGKGKGKGGGKKPVDNLPM